MPYEVLDKMAQLKSSSLALFLALFLLTTAANFNLRAQEDLTGGLAARRSQAEPLKH
jgi:hypothetical protein